MKRTSNHSEQELFREEVLSFIPEKAKSLFHYYLCRQLKGGGMEISMNAVASTKNKEKLKGKDLITVGIYSAISFVIIFAVALLGYIPIFMPLLTVIVPIINGTPFMLFLTKVKKFGMIWIMSIIMGTLMMLTGMGYWPLLISIISGFLAELIYRSGDYKSAAKGILAHGVYCFWIWGNFIPLFTNIEKYFSTRQDYGQEYIDTLTSLMPGWMCPTLFVACFVSGLLGGLIGKALLKKHFTRAGIA